MTEQSEATITAFLHAIDRGEPRAKDKLWEAVYSELHALASDLMRGESVDHTLQPTALVHEAYARLFGGEQLRQKSRAYFFGAAAQAMRRILIEHGRRQVVKRRATGTAFPLSYLSASEAPVSVESLDALDGALDALADHDRRAFDVIMLRFFGGLSVEQTADILESSPRTVKRCWSYGRTWLYRRIVSGE